MKQIIDEIADKDDFLNFMKILINDFKNNPEEWENKNLQEYLEGIANWTGDMDGYYENNNLPIPTNINWQVFANILNAAKMYE